MAKSHEEIQDQLVQYARQLLASTLDGRVEWKTTERERRFHFAGTQTGAYIENVDDHFALNDRRSYMLSLLNKDDVAVAELKSKWSSQLGMDTRSAAWNETLEELYNAAKRIAYNVDEVLKAAFKELP